ncbi:MAG: hypothetical protein HYY21_11715 [Candidatus Tectomicrobia bacterium]|nr:hypothetical protein [Candidatus Tectomicrobia bacterium]
MKRIFLASGLVFTLIFGVGAFSSVWAWSCPKSCGDAQAAIQEAESGTKAAKGDRKSQGQILINRAKRLHKDGLASHQKGGSPYDHSLAVARCGASLSYAKAALVHVKGQ